MSEPRLILLLASGEVLQYHEGGTPRWPVIGNDPTIVSMAAAANDLYLHLSGGEIKKHRPGGGWDTIGNDPKVVSLAAGANSQVYLLLSTGEVLQYHEGGTPRWPVIGNDPTIVSMTADTNPFRPDAR